VGEGGPWDDLIGHSAGDGTPRSHVRDRGKIA